MDHLQVEIFNLQISYARCVGAFGWAGVGERDLVVRSEFSLVLFMYTFYAKNIVVFDCT